MHPSTDVKPDGADPFRNLSALRVLHGEENRFRQPGKTARLSGRVPALLLLVLRPIDAATRFIIVCDYTGKEVV